MKKVNHNYIWRNYISFAENSKLFSLALVLFEQKHCICWIFFIRSLTKIYSFSAMQCEQETNTTSADVIEDTMEKDLNDDCFCSFQKFGSIFDFLSLQDEHLFISTRCETGQKCSTKALFNYIFLKLVQINYTFSDNIDLYTNVLYIWFTITGWLLLLVDYYPPPSVSHTH